MATKTVKTRYGHSMVVDPGDHIGRSIIRKGIYDRRGVAYITALLAKIGARNVLDIGANIGNHALAFSRFARHVWCFEPNPQAYALLARNVAANRLENVSTYNFGLSDADRAATLFVDGSGNIGASTLREESRIADHDYVAQPVALRSGDRWVEENALAEIDFIKLDVEGHEAFVLRGLADTLRRQRPIVIMEWSDESSDKEGLGKGELLRDLFPDYAVYALFVNTDRAYWRRKPFGALRRLWAKVTGKRMLHTRYAPDTELSITDLLFVPNERAGLLGE